MGGFLSGIGSALGTIGSVLAAPATGGASLALGAGGAALNFLGGMKAQSSQENSVLQQEQFQSGSTAQQMAFQERMSDTMHQREVTDLKAAGLNPLLSVNGGASTPSGSSATGANIGSQENVLSGAVSSAFQAIQMKAQLDNIAADIGLKKAQAQSVSKDAGIKAPAADFNTDHPDWARALYVASQGGEGVGKVLKALSSAKDVVSSRPSTFFNFGGD